MCPLLLLLLSPPPLPSAAAAPFSFSFVFCCCSLTHLPLLLLLPGWDPVIQPLCNSSYSSYELNRIVVEDINHLPGSVQWPDAMGGGTVEEPVGVIMTGDLVDRGPEAIGYPQWTNYTNLFGLTGEGLLNYPVYEGYGNHDGGNLTSGKDYPNFVRWVIIPRGRRSEGCFTDCTHPRGDW